MSDAVGLRYCEPHPISNDYWHDTVSKDLLRRLPVVGTSPDRCAALVVGAGTLPFTLDLLPSTVVVADLYKSVVDGVRDRCDTVANSDSWTDYVAHYASDSASGEFYEMQREGLVRDIEPARQAAKRLRIVPAIGNILTTIPYLLEDTAVLSGKTFTFVNFTNVAQYLSSAHGTEWRAPLASLLRKMPVHEHAVICDSLSSQQVTLYTPEQYLKFAA